MKQMLTHRKGLYPFNLQKQGFLVYDCVVEHSTTTRLYANAIAAFNSVFI